MLKKSLLFPIVAALSLAISFTSCQKEGDTGPVGPAGPTGPTGPTGPAGPTGTANVIYSDWIDVTFDPTTDEDTGDTLSWSAAIRAEQITSDILNSGEIKVYINFNTADDPVVFPLPYFDGGVIINPVFYTDTIALVATADASTQEESGAKFLQYRYVIIPGSVLAAKPESVNLDNYLEMKKYLKLND